MPFQIGCRYGWDGIREFVNDADGPAFLKCSRFVILILYYREMYTEVVQAHFLFKGIRKTKIGQ